MDLYLARGRCIDSGKWVYGYYCKHEKRQICPMGDDVLQDEEIKHLIIRDTFADWNMPKSLEGVEVDPKTVGRYTGRKDKHGNKIFLGEIIKDCEGYIKTIVWKDDGFKSLYVSHRTYQGEAYTEDVYNKLRKTEDRRWGVEVLGNIHDNAELLETH